MRSVLLSVLALVICLGFVTVLLADPGEITDVAKGKITVKVGDKSYETEKGVSLLTSTGDKAKGKDFKKGDKVEVKITDGKVTEIKQK
jgi:hypothetical protein